MTAVASPLEQRTGRRAGSGRTISRARWLEREMSPRAQAHWRTAGGAALGAAAGAAYAHFIGCNTGTCPLTANVWTAALFFGFAGGVVGLPGPRSAKSEEPHV